MLLFGWLLCCSIFRATCMQQSAPLLCPPIPIDVKAIPKLEAEHIEDNEVCKIVQRGLERAHKNVLFAFQHATMAIRSTASNPKPVVSAAERMFGVILEALEAGRLRLCAACLSHLWPASDNDGPMQLAVNACRILGVSFAKLSLPSVSTKLCGDFGQPLSLSADLLWEPLFHMLSDVQAMGHAWVERWGWAEEFDGPVVQPGDLFYPSLFSPVGVCNISSLRSVAAHRSFFVGEHFGKRPWRDLSGFLVKHLSMAELMQLVSVQIPLSWRVINLGAHRGECLFGPPFDPANCLVFGLHAEADNDADHEGSFVMERARDDMQLFGGILVDKDPTVLKELATRAQGRRDIVVLDEALVPSTVVKSLAAAWDRIPQFSQSRFGVGVESVDLVKIDVDNLQCDLVRAMIFGSPPIWPKVFHIEFSRFHPPPLITRTDSESSEGSALACFLDALGGVYGLLHVEFYNAVFVRRELLSMAFPGWDTLNDMAKWQLGYFCHPLSRVLHAEKGEWLYNKRGVDIRAWADPALPLASRSEWAASFEEVFNYPSGR